MSTQLSVDEAIAAIERCAFTIPDRDNDGEPMYQAGRRIVHCFIGTMGADWDVAAAIDEVRNADRVGWAHSLFGECLVAVMPDERRRTFDTVTPEVPADD